MNYRLLTLWIGLLLFSCQSKQKPSKSIITTDIPHFWEAFDSIQSTTDTTLQHYYLDNLYFKRGTPGLTNIRVARNYTSTDYLTAIRNYPQFWESIRENTLKASHLGADLEVGIEALRRIYPKLRPAKIYFTIGALRTGGTTMDSLVLIGSELAMTDQNTVSTEFSEDEQQYRRAYFDTNPINQLVLLNTHEYVHTQQQPMVHNLLSLVIYEGVAEFVSSLAMNRPSAAPSIAYGKKYPESVRKKFEQEMFYANNRPKWLWSNAENDFGLRDMGYYIGYQMCENYYNQAPNKPLAIQKMIELDFANESEIEAFVTASHFFSAPLSILYENFEKSRPFIIEIEEFENNSQTVNPQIKQITFRFSQPLNGYNTGIDFGELGESFFPPIRPNERVWGTDNKSWSIAVDLAPNTRYQFLISNNFRTNSGIPLKPLLVDFKTSENPVK
ncbi:gliding motility protein GldB-related protein [Acidiluteibacter ferrifornacis]|uniref:DUF2268 domain-containing protein n=1 Tax=Acidiluteibacter ferrifornacis TaxID=2692424 RepID=A0A6N9NMN0_9FLAO|nr:hypothetical protein [Acidiluteibacter ferrifornacis]NBG67144.1 hypothetical protein [Acidiluteibacter ferrifornacis]